MSFDPTNLPNRKWLQLSEIVYLWAFEEIFDEKARLEAEDPSDRAYCAEIEETLESFQMYGPSPVCKRNRCDVVKRSASMFPACVLGAHQLLATMGVRAPWSS